MPSFSFKGSHRIGLFIRAGQSSLTNLDDWNADVNMIKSRLLQEQKLREDDMFSWLRGKAVRGSNQSHYNQ